MPAVTGPKPGIGGRRYRNTGTYGSPVWLAQLLDLDVSTNLAWDYVEAGSRATRAKLSIKARADLTISIKARNDDADLGAIALLAAAMSPIIVLDSLILNGPITTEGSTGFRGEFLVSLSGEPQEADGSIYHDYELKPTFTLNAAGPSTIVMGATSTIVAIAL